MTSTHILLKLLNSHLRSFFMFKLFKCEFSWATRDLLLFQLYSLIFVSNPPNIRINTYQQNWNSTEQNTKNYILIWVTVSVPPQTKKQGEIYDHFSSKPHSVKPSQAFITVLVTASFSFPFIGFEFWQKRASVVSEYFHSEIHQTCSLDQMTQTLFNF